MGIHSFIARLARTPALSRCLLQLSLSSASATSASAAVAADWKRRCGILATAPALWRVGRLAVFVSVSTAFSYSSVAAAPAATTATDVHSTTADDVTPYVKREERQRETRTNRELFDACLCRFLFVLRIRRVPFDNLLLAMFPLAFWQFICAQGATNIWNENENENVNAKTEQVADNTLSPIDKATTAAIITIISTTKTKTTAKANNGKSMSIRCRTRQTIWKY